MVIVWLSQACLKWCVSVKLLPEVYVRSSGIGFVWVGSPLERKHDRCRIRMQWHLRGTLEWRAWVLCFLAATDFELVIRCVRLWGLSAVAR